MKRYLAFRILAVIMIAGAVLLPDLTGSGAQNAVSLNREGWNYYNRSEYNRAIFSFTSSLRLNRRYTDSIIGAAKSYYALGVYNKSLDLFYDALRLDASSVDALNGMGMCLAETGRFTDAIKYFEKAYTVSGNSVDAQYGIAYVYYRMDKRLWAKRKLENIFRSNPYHFQSLLLMGDIKTDEGRLKEARGYVEKAIDSNTESAEGHIRYGSILLKNYLHTGEGDSLVEAMESFHRALALSPGNFRANMDMGLISLMEMMDYNSDRSLSGSANTEAAKSRGETAVSYISKAAQVNRSLPVLYALSLAYELSGDKSRSLESMLDAYTKYPSDSVLKGKIENFLVLNEYKSAHPARIMFSNENIELSRASRREALHVNVMYYLRRSLLLNPLNREIREQLINYYSILDYNEIMIDEMKTILSQYPEFRYQDRLNLAIIKRRDRLYCREGYATEETPRDVPGIVVLNFDSGGKIADHPDAGRVFAENLTFAIQQFGRMKTPGIIGRDRIAGSIQAGGENLFRAIKHIKELPEKEGVKADLLVFGDIMEIDDYISVTCRVMDMEKGYIINEFSESRKGRENLNQVAVTVAGKLYDLIPYYGRVLKLKENGILVNMGLIDGVKSGSELVIYRDSMSRLNNETIRYAEIFRVREADTYLCYAEPDRADILRDIDSTVRVYPLMKKRARMIE